MPAGAPTTRALHVEAWGSPDAARVVCLHGVTGHGGGARRLAEGWLGDYRVLAPDLLGHGSSPYEPPWGIAEHLDLLVRSLGSEPAVWIGHSFGGRLALEIAAGYPALVTRLVLLDPAILIDPGIALHVADWPEPTDPMRRSTKASTGASRRARSDARRESSSLQTSTASSSPTPTAAGAIATARRRSWRRTGR